MQIDVVTLGETMVLFQPWQEGPLVHAAMFIRTMGGAESNVAIGLSRLGKRVRWISRVGTDPFGDYILSTLRGEGVDVSYVDRDPAFPTAVFFKEYKGYGDPNVYYYRKGSAVSQWTPDDVRREWFDGVRWLHVTGITPALGTRTFDMVLHAVRTARSMGLLVSFDPNLRRKLWDEETARRTLLALTSECDLFLPGMDEARFLLGDRTEEEYGKAFLDMGAKVIALKLGARGAMGFTRSDTVYVPGVPAPRIVDTVGAGDAFACGILSVFIDHRALHDNETIPPSTLEAALRRGNLLGSLIVQSRGDWEGTPKLEELNRIEANQTEVSR